MGMYAVQTADAGDLATMGEAARNSRAVAISRRRALAAGKSALPATNDRVRNGFREGRVPAPAGPMDAAPSVSSNGHAPPSASSNGQAPPSAAPVAADVPVGQAAAPAPVAAGVTDAHLGRALSIQRRRQQSQGRHALGGASAAARPEAPTAASAGVSDAHLGRSMSMQRRRQQSLGSRALAAPVGPPRDGGAPAPEVTPAPATRAGGVADAHLGRSMSIERRRRLSQGKQALTGASGAPAVAESVETDLSSGRERARARRAEASRYGSEAFSRPQPEGQVAYAPKVIVSPTHGGQRVTGLRIGQGVRVTGGEAGAALPVSGTQYVAADGPPAVPGSGQKVGLTRTAQGLTVSGTAVRNRVAITGDELGEHLRITGQADQKLEDDLTSRSDGSYRPAQFTRRANPHGASAVGPRLTPPTGVAPSAQDGSWQPLETTTGGLTVSGTAVGRSGRVTGNEAGSCRPITGNQYAALASAAGTCSGTASAYPQGRLDPVTGGKVSVAQTWSGQRVTGPSVEHRPNVTGDEPGSCRTVTGTPYQGPSTAFGWCEAGEGDGTARRLGLTQRGVAVSGDVPMHSDAVTGTARGRGSNVTGTPYYSDMRAAQAAADDWTGSQAFPVALARRLADQESTGDAKKESGDVRLSPSSVPGRITGSFTYGDGKVTGNKEFLFRARPNRESKQSPVTGEGRTEGRTITGSAWTANDRVTGTEGYIAAGRNPSEGGGVPHGWAGASKFRDQGTSAAPRQTVTGLSGSSPKAGSKITLSGGAQG